MKARPLTGLSVADTSSPIATYDQLGGRGVVYNKALAIPVHLGGAWQSIEYVSLPPASAGECAYVGEHVQRTDEIYFIQHGQGRLITNGSPQQVGPGFLAIAPHGTRHSIANLSTQESLAFLVIELRTPAYNEGYPPTCVTSLFDWQPPIEDFRVARLGNQPVPLRATIVELARYFSAPWGQLALMELPAGVRIEDYTLQADENLFVVSGNATIGVAHQRFDSFEYGLNVLVPGGITRSISNRSSHDPLHILSVTVHSPQRAPDSLGERAAMALAPVS